MDKVESFITKGNIYRKYHRLAYYYTHNNTKAEDLVSITVLKCLEHKDSFTGDEDQFNMWFKTILYYSFINTTRSGYTRNMTEVEVKFYPGVHIQQTEAKDYLNVICKQKIRGVEILRLFAEGYSMKELCKMYDLNISSLKNAMFRTRKKIKDFALVGNL